MNDKFNTFLNLWNGKYVSVLSTTSRECFDLAVKWTDTLGVPHYQNNPSPFPYANASQIYTDFSSFQAQYFDRIANTPDAIPQAGDIIVWSASYNGGVGHVGICTTIADINHFQCFEQNDPIGSNSHLKDYNYAYVLGWLRYKQPITDCPAKLSAMTLERDRLNGVITGKDATITDLNKQITTLKTQLTKVVADMTADCQSKLTLQKEKVKVFAESL